MKIFLITPHSVDKNFEEKLKIVSEVCQQNGMKAETGVINYDGNFNFDKSVELYQEVNFFIADLSFERPSCYYEVGYAQALNKKIFLIAEEGTFIHQVNNKSSLQYYKTLKEYKELIARIVSKLKPIDTPRHIL